MRGHRRHGRSLEGLPVGLEAFKAVADRGGCGGIDAVEVLKQCVQRSPQAIEVQSVKPCLAIGGQRIVVRSQPFDQTGDFAVCPQPIGPTSEVAQRFDGALAGIGQPANKAIHSVAVGPIRQDRHKGEPFFPDQPSVRRWAPEKSFRRSIGGLAQQDVASLADPVDDGIKVGGGFQGASQRLNLGEQGREIVGNRRGVATDHDAKRCAISLIKPNGCNRIAKDGDSNDNAEKEAEARPLVIPATGVLKLYC